MNRSREAHEYLRPSLHPGVRGVHVIAQCSVAGMFCNRCGCVGVSSLGPRGWSLNRSLRSPVSLG